MKKTALMLRCLPRVGYDNTEVRMIDLDLAPSAELEDVRQALTLYFATRGISDAIFDVGADDDGLFAIINDEAYEQRWGTPIL